MPILQNGEIILYGFVGDNFWDEGFTWKDVLGTLAEVGADTDVTVRINSAGGYASEGVAIYNAFAMHGGKVTMIAEGIVASAASTIFMAGEERIMRMGSTMMIHDPEKITWGGVEDHQTSINELNAIGNQMARIYASRSGDDPVAFREEMKGEIWLSGAEAVERGLATSESGEPSTAVAAFDFSLYAKAPQELQALASANSWVMSEELARKSKSVTKPVAAANPETTKGKSVMPQDKTQATATAAPTAPAPETKPIDAPATASADDAKGRIKAILEAPEAKGREAMAKHLAFDTDQTAEAAIELLKVAPEAAAPAAPAADATAYAAERQAAAPLAAPGAGAGTEPPNAKAGWGKVSSRINTRI